MPRRPGTPDSGPVPGPAGEKLPRFAPSAEQCYSAAKREIQGKRFDRAASLFELFLKLSTDRVATSKALFKLGFCRFVLRQYEASIAALEKSLENQS